MIIIWVEWRLSRVFGILLQIHQKNLGRGQTSPPFWQCQDFESFSSGNPSLTVRLAEGLQRRERKTKRRTTRKTAREMRGNASIRTRISVEGQEQGRWEARPPSLVITWKMLHFWVGLTERWRTWEWYVISSRSERKNSWSAGHRTT